MKPRTVFVLFLSFVLSSVASVRDPIVDGVLAAMNQSIDPCQDFYGYSCGGWISGTKLPSDKSRYDRSFSIIEQSNQDVLRSIVQNPTVNKKLNHFFSSCMDLDTINAEGFAPAQTWLTFVEEAQDPTGLMLVTGALHAIGVGALFGIYVTIDAKNPAINIGGFAQGGLALPYTDLYLDNSTSSMTIRQQYVQHISNMFQLLGDDSDTADQEAQAVLDFETMIAQFTVPPDQLVDPFTTYNKIDISGLAEISPNLDWIAYLEGLGVNFTQATVDVPPYFSNLSLLVGDTSDNSSNWITYLRWQVIHAFATYLSQPFVDENFAFFGKILRGQKEQSPRWESCIQYTDSALGELLGNYFVQKAFSGESRMLATQILKGIEDAMKTDLTNLDWMDPVTRKRALTKLSKVSNMIGAPTNPKNYSQVVVDPDDFFGNVMQGNVFGISSQLAQIEQPSDKSQWGMTSPTVNAYYDPTRNQMVFPAGILQQPFFNASFPQAMNAGGIGMVMGHELTHGFDNQGRDYDGDGVLENWWEPATSAQFDKKVQCVIQQYSGFEVLPGVYINGQLTQGENIADMGGIKNSYNSFSKLIGPNANSPSIVPGLSNIQLFFVSFAQGWCEKVTDEYLRVQVQTDPHSPARFRVLGPLINLPQFSQTFQCKSGTPMNPTNRCEVW